jgi:hypothetical protein
MVFMSVKGRIGRWKISYPVKWKVHMRRWIKGWVLAALMAGILACQAIQDQVPVRKEMAGAPGSTTVTIRVKDMGVADAGVKKILERYAARDIQRQSREGQAFFYAMVLSDYYDDLLEKLKTIGVVESVISTRDIREGDVMVRIVIGSAP